MGLAEPSTIITLQECDITATPVRNNCCAFIFTWRVSDVIVEGLVTS